MSAGAVRLDGLTGPPCEERTGGSSGHQAPLRLKVTAQRIVSRLWGAVPAESLKALVVWAIGPRFVVSAVAVVFDDDGRVLLFKHTHDRAHPWGLPSGRLELGEQPEQALKREVQEEAGVTIDVGPLVALIWDEPRPVLRAAYLGTIRGGTFRPSAEVSRARYVERDDLPSTLRVLQRRMIDEAIRVRECRIADLRRTRGTDDPGA